MRIRLASLVLFAAVAGTTPSTAAKVNLDGQVTYRERIALPDDATLRIQLIDQALAQLPPRLDVQAPIGAGQVPLSFTLSFDDSLILPTHPYALIATISARGGILFRNFEPYAVDPLAPAQPVLIVAAFIGQLANGTSSEQPTEQGTPEIFESTWTVTSIGGAAVEPGSTSTMQIGADMRAGGSGGCNSWFAPVQLTDDTLRLGGITSTAKSCGQARNLQEKAFLAALAAATTWQVDANQLTLYGADGKVLVVLVR